MGKRKKSAVHEENIEEDEQNQAESSSSSNDKSLYEILGVEKTASQQEIKKAYHKLALRLHPDKNPGDEDAKEKFQHLQKVISILGDEEKRAVYDQTGCVDDTDLAGDVVQNLKDYFRSMYKKVTEADIEEFESNYRGSESEKNDLIDLYKKYKGHMNMLFCSMLCSEPKLDSHRFKDILDEAISAGELKSTKAYQKWGKQVSETKPPVNPLQRRGKSNTKMDSSDSSYTSELISLFLQGKREVDALIQSMIDDEEVMSLFTRASSSNPQRRTYVKRDCVSANERLMQDYFNEHPTYDEKTFRRRFRMSKRLFLRIARDLEGEYEYFQQREDTRHQLGFTCIQKCTTAIRILAYGNTTDINDDYLNMAEKTSRDALENFCNGIINMYKDRYLRSPTFHDLNRIYDVHQVEHSFPGMIGSIGCMHWEWSNCPTAWRGQYTCGDHGVPTVSLQAICSQDLWVWSAFFGSVGSNNDINLLNASPVLDQYISRSISVLPFYANDNEYEHGYYLGDEIYPEYSIIVKTFQDPIDERRSHFKKKQEFARKDVERLFRILKKRWSYVKNPCRVWALEKMSDAMYTCIILHNMILEDEGRATCQHYVPGSVPGQFPQQTRQQRIQNQCLLQSSDIHNQLKDDLVLDVWGSRNFQGDPEDEESTNN